MRIYSADTLELAIVQELPITAPSNSCVHDLIHYTVESGLSSQDLDSVKSGQAITEQYLIEK